MKPEAQRIAIAEACGWTGFGRVDASSIGGRKTLNGCPPNNKDCFTEVPDYLSDLNAMHEAEMTLPPEPMVRYCANLYDIVARDYGQSRWEQFHDAYKTARCVLATAAQRAEAFALNLWKP